MKKNRDLLSLHLRINTKYGVLKGGTVAETIKEINTMLQNFKNISGINIKLLEHTDGRVINGGIQQDIAVAHDEIKNNVEQCTMLFDLCKRTIYNTNNESYKAILNGYNEQEYKYNEANNAFIGDATKKTTEIMLASLEKKNDAEHAVNGKFFELCLINIETIKEKYFMYNNTVLQNQNSINELISSINESLKGSAEPVKVITRGVIGPEVNKAAKAVKSEDRMNTIQVPEQKFIYQDLDTGTANDRCTVNKTQQQQQQPTAIPMNARQPPIPRQLTTTTTPMNTQQQPTAKPIPPAKETPLPKPQQPTTIPPTKETPLPKPQQPTTIPIQTQQQQQQQQLQQQQLQQQRPTQPQQPTTIPTQPQQPAAIRPKKKKELLIYNNNPTQQNEFDEAVEKFGNQTLYENTLKQHYDLIERLDSRMQTQIESYYESYIDSLDKYDAAYSTYIINATADNYNALGQTYIKYIKEKKKISDRVEEELRKTKSTTTATQQQSITTASSRQKQFTTTATPTLQPQQYMQQQFTTTTTATASSPQKQSTTTTATPTRQPQQPQFTTPTRQSHISPIDTPETEIIYFAGVIKKLLDLYAPYDKILYGILNKIAANYNIIREKKRNGVAVDTITYRKIYNDLLNTVESKLNVNARRTDTEITEGIARSWEIINEEHETNIHNNNILSFYNSLEKRIDEESASTST